MNLSELYARGLRLRQSMFGEADVEKRMTAAGSFGAPLQNIINAYVYGDVWSRGGLSNDIRSLVMLGITAASKDEDGIAFNEGYGVTGADEDWRWTEEWLPHAAWYLYAVSLPHD